MSKITNLTDYIKENKKESNDKTSIFERELNKLEKLKREKKEILRQLEIVDRIFSVEYVIAKKYCSKLECSKGFRYFLDFYGTSDKCMNYVCKKYFDQLLYNANFDLEERVHNDFDDYDSFSKYGPNKYVINILSYEDSDLSNFLRSEPEFLDLLKFDLDRIKGNWNGINDLNEREKYKKMLRVLDSYFESHKFETSLYKNDIIIYLATKNDILDTLSKYYIVEDEDIYELAKENKLDEVLNGKIVQINDKKIVDDMDTLMNKVLNGGKVQKLR